MRREIPRPILRFLGVLCGLSFALGSQATAQAHSLGFKTGIAYSTFSGQASEAWRGTAGLTGGAYVALRVHGRLALQVETVLTQKDLFKRDASSGWVEWTDRLRAAYLELPVLLRYAITASRTESAWFLTTGVAPAFALSCEEVATPRLLTGTGPLPQTSRYECNRLLTYPDSPEIIAVLGLGGQVHTGVLPLVFEIRYAAGLFDLAQSQYKQGTHFAQWHNATFTATLGVLLAGEH